MKKLLILILTILVVCAETGPVKATAIFKIVSTKQAYYPEYGDYGFAEVDYSVKNTGQVLVPYYKVWFKAYCSDGTTYTDWHNGGGIEAGKTISKHTIILNTTNRHCTNIIIISNKILSYDDLLNDD